MYNVILKKWLLVLAVVLSATVSSEAETKRPIDIDLAPMSGTMVYSMVYQLVSSPKKYIGKRIRIKGQFSSYYDEETNRRFYGCVISDALACCSQGLAFELATPRKYPDEYPSEGTSIMIDGVFDFEEEESGAKFPIIKKAKLTK